MLFEAVISAYKRLGADLSALEGILSEALGCPGEEPWADLFTLIGKILANTPLGTLGLDAPRCAELAESVINNQQRLLRNNPIPLSREDIESVYLSCL
jgi:4-hydroxybutyrate dehydrogenase